jgi:PQQ-dependent catabolism-associated CXXCW motif protein
MRMRGLVTVAVLLATIVAALPAAAQLMYEGKRHALVIGNGKYPTGALTNPGNDARAMGETLKKLGFSVDVKFDLGSEDMRRSIADFGRRLAAGGVGLFYYAGHGVQIDGANYLLPVDSAIRSEVDVDVKGVSVRQVLSVLGRADSAMNIVILDACRDNPFVRNFRSGASGLAAPDSIQAARNGGTLVAFATSPQSVAQDSKNEQNGLYTGELTKAMLTPGLTLEGVFKRVRTEVSRRSNGQQVPQDWSQLMGEDFYLLPRVAALPPTPSPSPAPAPRDDAAFELAFWDSIRDSDQKADYEAYLQKYPSGNFAPLAKERIRRLQTASLPSTAAPVPTPAPAPSSRSTAPSPDAQKKYEEQRVLAARQAWDRTKTTSDPAYLVRFIQQYPDSEFAPEARQRLKTMVDRSAALPANPMTVQQAEARKRAAEQNWGRVAQADDPLQYLRFATSYPDAPASATAKARMFELLDGYMKVKPATAQTQPRPAAPPPASTATTPNVWGSFGGIQTAFTRNYDWETRDFGTPPQATLRLADFDQPTPNTIPGAKLIRTDQLQSSIDRGERPVLIDVSDAPPGHKTIPGANTLYGFGVGGDFKDQTQKNLAGALAKITANNKQAPLVIFCVNPQCWKSYNVSLRAAALGYPNVYWYRGGLDAWDQAGLRMAPAGGASAARP